jgi:hypothetical protein
VPYSEHQQAKSAGARWDQGARRWYAPRPGMAQLARWAARPPLPVLLPGEDRSFGAGLAVDPVPETTWFTNARSCISERDWERVRRMVVNRAGRQCEIPGCGQTENRARAIQLEVHERWHYDPVRRVQTLRRLICLCTWCHTATHFGLASVRGTDREAFAHLLTVTGMSAAAAERHIDDAFALWQQRSATSWSLDLGILTSAGIALARPVGTGATRAQTAARELHRARRAEPAPAPPPAKRTGWPWVNMQGQLDEPRQAQG